MVSGDREDWREQISRRAEVMEAASIESANQALKALLLLNGGACIALLGFLASTFNGDSGPTATSLGLSTIAALRWFGSGAGLAVVASCIAYLTNSAYSRGLRGADQFTWKADEISTMWQSWPAGRRLLFFGSAFSKSE